MLIPYRRFQDNLSVPFSWASQSGPTGCAENVGTELTSCAA